MADSSHPQDDKAKINLFPSDVVPWSPDGDGLKALVDKLPTACVLATDDQILYANLSAAGLLKAESPNELIGRPALDLFAEQDRKWLLDCLSAAPVGDKRLPAREMRISALDGSPVDIELDMIVIDLGGRPAMLATVREIARRRQLRAAYRNLVENSLQGFAIVQHDRIMFANQALARITSCPLENILGASLHEWFEALHPDDRPIAEANWQKRRKGLDAAQRMTCRFMGTDERLRWLECLFAATDYLGEEAIQVAVSDVSERIEAEQALRLSEGRFRTIFEQSSIGIYRTTPDGEIIMANPAMVRMLGYRTFEELARRNLKHEGYEPGYPRSEFMDLMEQKGRVDGLEAAWKRGDGTTIYVRESARVVRDEHGRIQYYDGTVEDVTRRRVAEQKLQEEHQQLLSIFDGLDATIYACDPETHELLYFNQVASKQWGEPNGRRCFEVLQNRSEPCPYCTNDRIFSPDYEGRSYVWEHLNESNQRWYRCVDKAITWPDGRRVRFEMAHDITNERRLTEEMAKAEKLESIGVLAGGIAHDFNNLLTGILGNISLARSDLQGNSVVGEMLEQAEEAAMRARTLTQQLLTFSRGGAPVTALTSIQSLLRECSEFALAGSTARCRFDLADDLDLVEVDEGQLSQVIANLITNAHQAMPEGGEVVVSARNIGVDKNSRLPLSAGAYVRMSVRDRGVGIPADVIGRIFDPFFTTKEFGRGLGLTTSFAIVRKHGGHLAVESQTGHGSTFHVYLPASESDTKSSPNRLPSGLKAGGHILVVDDEEVVRSVAEITLTKLGYRVTMAVSGEEAVEVIRQTKSHGGTFELAIIDLTMPGGIDGVEAFRRMRDIEPTLCAVVSSGYANSSVMADYRDHGFSAAIEKPYSFTRLAEAVQEALSAASS